MYKCALEVYSLFNVSNFRIHLINSKTSQLDLVNLPKHQLPGLFNQNDRKAETYYNSIFVAVRQGRHQTGHIYIHDVLTISSTITVQRTILWEGRVCQRCP